MHRITNILITLTLFSLTASANNYKNTFFHSNDSINEALFDESEINDRQISTYTAEADSTRENGNSEEFDLPEGLMVNIDSLLNSWQARNLLNVLDCDADEWVNRTTSDTVYAQRLRSLPTIVDMPYNNMVRSCIDRYTTRNRSHVSYILGMAEYYMPIIEAEIDRMGVPHELKYLPIIESAFNPKAVSSASAKGLWQFIFSTGKLYGLRANNYIDERFDPIKSTRAALHYLNDLHTFFDSWELAIAAYNCGPGNVKKAILRSGNKTSFWEIYPWLPRETRGYLPGFIAATYIMTYHKEHGICPMEPTVTVSTDTIHINKNLHFRQVSEICNIDIEEIRALNPQYLKDIIPGENETFVLRLPNEQISEFLANEDTIYKHKVDEFFPRESVERMLTQAKSNDGGQGNLIRHKIRNGETLGSIARKYRVTVRQIMRWNNMRSTNIRAGRYLKIYR